MLMWDIHRTMNAEYFGTGRTTLYVEFGDFVAKSRRWWLVIQDGELDVCMKDPGHEIDLTISTDVQPPQSGPLIWGFSSIVSGTGGRMPSA
jgi:hypothetical protein